MTPDDVSVSKAPDNKEGELFVANMAPDLRDALLSRQIALGNATTLDKSAEPLWIWIRMASKSISFDEYDKFITRVLCSTSYSNCEPEKRLQKELTNLKQYGQHGVHAYELLRAATETFLLIRSACTCGPFDKAMHPTTFTVDTIASVPNRTCAPHAAGNDLSGCCPVDGTVLGPGSEPANLTLGDLVHKLEAYLGQYGSYLNTILKSNFGTNWQSQADLSAFCGKILCSRATCPSLIELIWSYWHEEGMLAQTLNAISLRFQNRRRGTGRDPLTELEIDPLRPLNNFLWGYIQDESNRLSVQRRAYEYSHHYGLTLQGKAIPNIVPADHRARFLEGLHELLYRCGIFFSDAANMTIQADGFPLLTALKEVNLLLAEGAHNQFGDLPWTARVEMLIQQWLLGRPEMHEFLGTRRMIPFKEAWMGRVDAMKRLQGWTDVTVTHFHDLAVFGEQLLLTIRHGNWSNETNPAIASAWAMYWKPEILGYIHAYRAATGVDLALDATDEHQARARVTLPSVLLRNRLLQQNGGAGRLSAGNGQAGQKLFSPAAGSRPVPVPATRRLPGA